MWYRVRTRSPMLINVTVGERGGGRSGIVVFKGGLLERFDLGSDFISLCNLSWMLDLQTPVPGITR